MAQTKVKLISDGVIVQGNLHASHGITTAHIGEGSNLYYTDARVGSYLSTNSFATESYVGTQIANLVDSSPEALNTLNELAAALGDDADFSTTVTNSIALKAPLASPSFTGNAAFAGNVTVGANTVQNGANPGLKIQSTNTSQTVLGLHNSTSRNWEVACGGSANSVGAGSFYIYDNTADAARLEIDTSGNVTVGTGIIKPSIGGDIAITQGVIGLRINDAASAISPSTATSNNDNAVDLGVSNIRFKNLYMGGNGTFGGKVGIGMTSPTRKLHIVNTDDTRGILVENTLSTSYAEVHVKASREFRIGTGNSSSATDARDRFYVYDATAAAHRFTIDSSGKVGIATTSPTEKLHVEGRIRLGSTPVICSHDNVGIDIDQNNNSGSNYFRVTRDGEATELFRVQENGNVGIGNTAPQRRLTIGTGGNGSETLSIYAPSTASSAIHFTDTNASVDYQGFISYSHSDDALRFGTTESEKMRLDSNGNLGIGTTDIEETLTIAKNGGGDGTIVGLRSDASFSQFEIATKNSQIDWGLQTIGARNMYFTTNGVERMRILSSGGITFNGDTAAANALDDYEEGTWTPDIHGSTTRGTVSYQYRSGSYTKIGNRVWCRFGFKLSSISGAAGRVRVDGLPFTSRSYGAYQEPNFSVSTGLLATTANAYKARMFIVNNSSYLEGRISVNTDTIWNISDFGGDEWIILAFHYETHI